MKAGCAGWRVARVGLALAASWGTLAAQGEPVLYEGDGGWAAVAGMPGGVRPPDDHWQEEGGVWLGRIPAGAEETVWGEVRLPLAEAKPPPPAGVLLPTMRNAFRPCVVRSLAVRFDTSLHGRRWSQVLAKDGQAPEFAPLEFSAGRSWTYGLEIEDVPTGRRWALLPERMGREGGIFAKGKGGARLYSGSVDEGDLDWVLLTAEGAGGRRILQGRVTTVKSASRLLRVRVLLNTGAAGKPVAQAEAEAAPAVVAVSEGTAVAVYADLAEPRRMRAAAGRPGTAGLEFDLAPTKSTGNFPRSATFSVEVDAWATADADAALREAAARLPRGGGSVALPDEVQRSGLDARAVVEPVRTRLRHPGGFRDAIDAVDYLMVKMSGLFADHDWAASAFLCAAQDAAGAPRVVLEGEEAVVAVNPDPDLETMLELGQNRGQTVRERIQRSGAKAALVKAAGTSPGLDHHARALYLCDYPAVWEDGEGEPGVDLRHAEAELIASLACMLRDDGICLVVEDPGPLAPFTTYMADALACASAEPAEMRRQRALAGPRPVLWLAEAPGPEAETVARDLGFVRPGKLEED